MVENIRMWCFCFKWKASFKQADDYLILSRLFFRPSEKIICRGLNLPHPALCSITPLYDGLFFIVKSKPLFMKACLQVFVLFIFIGAYT